MSLADKLLIAAAIIVTVVLPFVEYFIKRRRAKRDRAEITEFWREAFDRWKGGGGPPAAGGSAA